MAYSEGQKTKIVNDILSLISQGSSLVKACKEVGLDRSMFYDWGVNKTDNYARACDERAMLIFEDCLDIADKQDKDVITTPDGEVINHNIIQRNKLQIDTRKWFLSKMLPAKYGDKLEIDQRNTNYNVELTKEEVDQINKQLENEY